MPYELTINRVGALANVVRNGHTRPAYEGRELIASFRKHADSIARKPAFAEAEDAVLALAREADPNAAYVAEGIAPGNEVEPIEIFPMPKDSPFVPSDVVNVKDHLVGLLPSRKMYCTMGAADNRMKWILRLRASITACALERNCRLPKLWWTFEGIPEEEDPMRRPTERQASDFIVVTSNMAREAIPKLYAAYRDALSDVIDSKRDDLELRSERIHISLTDNEDRPLAEVIDAMTIERVPFSSIVGSEDKTRELAREGADEFVAFVNHVAGPIPMNDKTVSVFSEVPALKGLICEHKTDADAKIILAGLARSSSMRGGAAAVSLEQKCVEKREGYLRAASAARPLSAMLASREAILLDDRLTRA